MGSKLDCARQVIAVPLRPTVSYSEHMSSNAVAQSAAWEASQYGTSEDIETLQDKKCASTSRFGAVEECGSSLVRRSTQQSYGHAIDEFIGGYCSEPRLAFNRTVVLRYRFFLEQKNLAPSTINVRLAAVRRLEAQGKGIILNHQPAMTPTIVLLPHFNPS
jgi:hypothetical protein